METNSLSLKEELYNGLKVKLIEGQKDLLLLRDDLVFSKNKGMEKESMMSVFDDLRVQFASTDQEDTVLDLLDFVVGFCTPNLSLY